MMPSSSSSVSGRLARVRGLLLEPSVDLASVLKELEVVAAALRSLGPAVSPTELDAVRSEVARVARLAKGGEEFWRAWGRLAGLEPGYTTAGQFAAARPAPTLAIQG